MPELLQGSPGSQKSQNYIAARIGSLKVLQSLKVSQGLAGSPRFSKVPKHAHCFAEVR